MCSDTDIYDPSHFSFTIRFFINLCLHVDGQIPEKHDRRDLYGSKPLLEISGLASVNNISHNCAFMSNRGVNFAGKHC